MKNVLSIRMRKRNTCECDKTIEKHINKVNKHIIFFTDSTFFCYLLNLRMHIHGEVAEWLKAHAWKACLQEIVTGVRIPFSPQCFLRFN